MLSLAIATRYAALDGQGVTRSTMGHTSMDMNVCTTVQAGTDAIVSNGLEGTQPNCR